MRAFSRLVMPDRCLATHSMNNARHGRFWPSAAAGARGDGQSHGKALRGDAHALGLHPPRSPKVTNRAASS
jgi:hypothetical protein